MLALSRRTILLRVPNFGMMYTDGGEHLAGEMVLQFMQFVLLLYRLAERRFIEWWGHNVNAIVVVR